MANPFYVTVEGKKQGPIEGDVDQEGREGTILGYSYGSSTTIPRDVNTGEPRGVRTHHPIIFSKHTDKSSPLLWQAMTTGETLSKVTFDFYHINAQGENENHYSITLTDAVIVEMQSELIDTSSTTGIQADEMREHIHLTFKEIEWENKSAGTMATDSWVTS